VRDAASSASKPFKQLVSRDMAPGAAEIALPHAFPKSELRTTRAGASAICFVSYTEVYYSLV
jgi:hypothetical protein